MSAATDTYVLLRAFVDELARSGMRAACTSPGSRCAPLVLTLARERRLRCFSHIDERCAGFFALGLAKACGRPVAVACTSGTATAELLPAAVEAHQARVPLLLLTADRPPELRENGAGQAIDQLKLFGGAAKWFFELGTHEATPERLRWIRTLACRAYATAAEGRPGVVHLNFPLRDPLVPDAALPADSSARPGEAPYVRRTPRAGSPARAKQTARDALAEIVAGAQRGVVVAGRDERLPATGERSLGAVTAAFAAAAGWPLLADPLSGARRGAAAVAHYDALLRDIAFVASLQPDLVLRVGDLPVSKPLRTWLAGLPGVRQVALDPEGAWQDPASTLSDSLALEPITALGALAAAPHAPSDGEWLARWRSADEAASEAIVDVLGDSSLSEPAVAAQLGTLLPDDAILFVSSSMPVRDIESFWPARPDPPRVLCNRGANGIDGVVSAAFGAAAAGSGPVALLIGDVALAHDIGGLLAARRLGLNLTIVVVQNSGGAIFDFLPIAENAIAREPSPAPPSVLPLADHSDPDHRHGVEEAADIYTRHVATPTGLDIRRIASLYGIAHERVETLDAFRAALERTFLRRDRTTLLEVPSERQANVELHRRTWNAVCDALQRTAL